MKNLTIFILSILVFFILLVSISIPNSNAQNNSTEIILKNNTNQQQDKISIFASFFPMFDFVKNIGGEKVNVFPIIPLGVEPHDWEPTIQQVVEIQDADLIIINGAGFEPWIKKISDKYLDTSLNISLIAHVENGKTDSSSTIYDPHIWLDPILAKKQVLAIYERLSLIDPDNMEYYLNNTNNFLEKLDSLHNKIYSDLSECKTKDFLSFHDSYRYFADRYGLNQHTIFGMSPEGDISPLKLQQIINLANSLNITTIYSEDLVDTRLSDTIASELHNGQVLQLSPLERINEEEQHKGIGYVEKMLKNLENLMIGLKCN